MKVGSWAASSRSSRSSLEASCHLLLLLFLLLPDSSKLWKRGPTVSEKQAKTKQWEEQGIVAEIREDKLSYVVQLGNRLFIRSRKMLKIRNKGYYNERDDIKEEDSSIPQSLPRATSAHTFSHNPTTNLNQPRWDLGLVMTSPSQKSMTAKQFSNPCLLYTSPSPRD